MSAKLNPRRTDVELTVRNQDRPPLVKQDGRAKGRCSESFKLDKPVAGEADDGSPKVVDSGFGLLVVTFELDPPPPPPVAAEAEDASSSVEPPSRHKRARSRSPARPT